MAGGQKDQQGTPSPHRYKTHNNMTQQSARRFSAWMFILAVVLILTALFFFHWTAGALGVGIILWKISEAVWDWSATEETSDEK